MKKLFIVASLFVAAFAANAQDGFQSKNGHEVLPEDGDISISFDAVPYFELLGNTFNNTVGNTVNNAYSTSPFGSNAITGKYFLDATTAVRARVRIGLTSTTAKALVTKVGTTTGEQVEDVTKTKNTNVVLAVGIEKRRGSSRVQGYYGGELVFGIIGTSNVKTEFGNDLSAANTNGFAPRTTNDKNGNQFGVGPRGFVGVDFFIAPKIAIGGEFGWAIMLTKTGKDEVTTETWNGTAVVEKTSQTSAGAGSFGVDTDNLGGAINLSFYF